MTRRETTWVLVTLHALALWPVVAWYAERVALRGGMLWGLLPLAAAVVLVTRGSAPERPAPLGVATVLLAAYAVVWRFAPPLVGAGVGALSLASLLSARRLGRRLDPALTGLLVLALPDVTTLQFFVGWPFRTGVAAVVSGGLSAIGVDIARQGTLLVVEGRPVGVDGACSGIWMGWTAVLAWLALALARRLPPRTAWLGLAAVVPLVFVANALRTSSLALAAVRLDLPKWAHEGVGLVVFAALVAGIVALSERLPAERPAAERGRACAAS